MLERWLSWNLGCIISSVPLVLGVFRPFTLYTLTKGGQLQGDQPWVCIPCPISQESCLVVEWQTSQRAMHGRGILFPESSLVDCIPPGLLFWGPARIPSLHPEPLAAFFCCLGCSFDGWALALVPDSQVPQQFGGRCCHKPSAPNLHWVDLSAPAAMLSFCS